VQLSGLKLRKPWNHCMAAAEMLRPAGVAAAGGSAVTEVAV